MSFETNVLSAITKLKERMSLLEKHNGLDNKKYYVEYSYDGMWIKIEITGSFNSIKEHLIQMLNPNFKGTYNEAKRFTFTQNPRKDKDGNMIFFPDIREGHDE